MITKPLSSHPSPQAARAASCNVRAGDLHQLLHGRVFHAINGHRDAGATLCPGTFLYDKIPSIRQRAIRAQRGTSAPA